MLFYPCEERDDIVQVVVIPKYKGNWLLARHVDRHSLAFPSGGLMDGESPWEAAGRELREECGALDVQLWPVAVYGELTGGGLRYGQVFFAYIWSLVQDPPYIKAESCFFDESMEGLSRSSPQSWLLEKVDRWLTERRTTLYCVSGGVQNLGVSAEEHDAQSQRFSLGPDPMAASGLIIHKMDGKSLDMVCVFPDEAIKAAMSPLAKARGLSIRETTELGREGVWAFMAQGFPALLALLPTATADGCTALLGVHRELLATILGKCQINETQDAVVLDEKYLTPGERKWLAEKSAGKAAGKRGGHVGKTEMHVLHLTFLDEVLLEARVV